MVAIAQEAHRREVEALQRTVQQESVAMSRCDDDDARSDGDDGEEDDDDDDDDDDA
jgi:hypothetical protein